MTRVANPFYAARQGRARHATSRQRPRHPAGHLNRDGRDDRCDPPPHWTHSPCWYVVANTGDRCIFLTGPFRNKEDAGGAVTRSAVWAATRSGDEHAGQYCYSLHLHRDGLRASVLGRSPP